MAKAKSRTKSRTSLHRSSKRTQAAVLRGVNKVLAAHGITGRVAELHVSSTDDGCTDGQSKQVVCRKQPDGTIVCREECV